MKKIHSNTTILNIDEYGNLLSPSFHDGKINGIAICENKKIEISLSTVENEKYLLMLNNVKQFKASNFREGNIILDISLECKINPDQEVLNSLFDIQDGENTDNKITEDTSQSIKNGQEVLLAIVPSYGAEIYALVDSLEIKHLDKK